MKCFKCNYENPPESRFCSSCGTKFLPLEKTPQSQTETIVEPLRELNLGSTFADRYQIIEELGRGGMGRVYKVYDSEIKDKVALKLLKPEISADDKVIERFRNELKFARKIAHKNVCRMYDLNKEGKALYITMEYVSGEDLKSMIRMMGHLSPGKAIFIAKQICEGLIEAHGLGVVHRDLKPQNIMIDRAGNAHIMDFGIARSTRAEGLTDTGMIIGTPEYMSPEQVEGKTAGPRSDIYSLGIIIYEMVTGRVPFEGETPLSVAIKHKIEAPLEPKKINEHIPEQLNLVILKCLEKNEHNRYQKVEELYRELGEIEGGLPTTERVLPKRKPMTSKEITLKFGVKKLLIPASGIAALIILALALWLLIPKGKVQKISPPSPAPPSVEPKKGDFIAAGNRYWKDKNYSEAISQFKKLLAIEPKNFEAQLNIASVLKEQGKIDEAIQEYEKVIGLNSLDPRAYNQLGEMFEQKQELDKAVGYYRKHLEVAPGSPDSERINQKIKDLETKLKPIEQPEKQVIKPAAEEKIEKPKEAKIEAPKKMPPKPVESQPEPSKKEKVDLSSKLDKGIKAFDQGDYDQCIGQMGEILALEPGNPTAKYFLDEAKKKKEEKLKEQQVADKVKVVEDAYKRKDYQACITQAEEILKLDPKNAAAQKYLIEAKKREEEISREQEISNKLKGAEDAYQKGNYQECVNQAERVLQLDPKNAKASEFLDWARQKISQGQIKSLVNDYIQSIINKNLLTFYKNNGSSNFYLEIKKEAELIMNLFDQLQSQASNISIQFKGSNIAEVSFSHTITGVPKKGGTRQKLFEGTFKWEMERQEDNWKIISLTSQPIK